MTDERIAFENLAAALVEKTISYVWRGYGSALFVEIGDLTSRSNRDGTPGHPEGEVSLGIEWSWRIEDDVTIRCGSWSEEELWESSFDLLRGSRIETCVLFGRLPEIELAASSGIRLLSFSTTDGQPQWHLVDRRARPARWFRVVDGQLHRGDGNEPAF